MGTRKFAERSADLAIKEGRLAASGRESYIRGWLCLNRAEIKKRKKK